MKKTFPGHYRPTDEEFSELWKTCIFALDANVLLSFYRYSDKTSDELIGILNQIGDRLWVPHQAGLEYQENRLNVIQEQIDAYKKIRNLLKDAENSLREGFNLFAKHPLIDMHLMLKRVEEVFAEFRKQLDEKEKAHPTLLENDTVRDALTTLLDGKVGVPYSLERMNEIYKDGKARYDGEIPPGYKDTSKEGNRKYGDLVIWYQIIDRANELQKPIILITDDRKEDWWWKFQGKTVLPKPQLIQEMLAKTGMRFYMYETDRFMENAREYFKTQVKQEAIDEVRTIREHDEESLRIRREIDQTSSLARIASQSNIFGIDSDALARAMKAIREENARMIKAMDSGALWREMRAVDEENAQMIKRIGEENAQMMKGIDSAALWREMKGFDESLIRKRITDTATDSIAKHETTTDQEKSSSATDKEPRDTDEDSQNNSSPAGSSANED